MRETIDFGIDLGTTNSAIAVAEDGGARVIKNNDGWDYTPSAVWMPRQGMIHVGEKARQRRMADPEDAHVEFKLQMGTTDTSYEFRRAGRSMTPVELSGEVLKSLRQDAAATLGEPPAAAVITIPAAFGLDQSNATTEAAKLAGFTEGCTLLHEPNAAALAYGFDGTADAAPWMVFDLGGGTFDAAVMSRRDGELKLLQHAGDAYLGGKNIDWALVDKILAPAAARDLGLRDFERADQRWRKNFAKLKSEAETAKIALSRHGSVEVFTELWDESGELQPFFYTLTRDTLDDVALPFYTKAVELCRKALSQSSLRPDQIERLLLVGSATLSPGLRELLADPRQGVGIPIDHSQDPSTVVARGAAIYAGRLRASTPVPAPAVGEFSVELHYETESLEVTDVPVAGVLRASADMDFSGYAVSLHNPGGRPPYHGPKVSLSEDGRFFTSVAIDSNTRSRFTLELTDASGTRQRITPNTLSITHTQILKPDAVLTHSLGVEMADGNYSRILKRGATLPATGDMPYYTTIDLTQDDPNAVIRIPILEGEEADARHNKQVAELEFRRSDLRWDLERGSEVTMTIEIPKIGVPVARAEVQNEEFHTEIVAGGERPKEDMLRTALRRVESRLPDIKQRARTAKSQRSSASLQQVEERLPELRRLVDLAATDGDAALAAERDLRVLDERLDEIERAIIAIPELLARIARSLRDCEELLPDCGPEERHEYDRLKELAVQLTHAHEPEVPELSRLAQHLEDFTEYLERVSGKLDREIFASLEDASRAGFLVPRDRARELVAKGRTAIARRDMESLREVILDLRELVPPMPHGETPIRPDVPAPTPSPGRRYGGIIDRRTGGTP